MACEIQVKAMEKAIKSGKLKRIRSELIHGRDLARLLRTHIKSGSSFSPESIRCFIEGLVNSCNMSISMLTSSEQQKNQLLLGMPPGSRRARSIRVNSVCEDADCLLGAQSNDNNSGKRKCIKKVEKVVPAGAGLETALEDGYSWRKYGQKNILGSKYPRGYYKCAHKPTEGCSAKKQVQLVDEQGPPFFNITYCGDHTCSHHQQQLNNSQLSSPAPLNYDPSILQHVMPFPKQQPHQANEIHQYSGPILSTTTTRIEPEFPPTALINYQSDHMNIVSPNSMDVRYHPPISTSTTCPTGHVEVGFHGSACEVYSAIASTSGSPAVDLYQEIDCDPFYDVINWDFSC